MPKHLIVSISSAKTLASADKKGQRLAVVQQLRSLPNGLGAISKRIATRDHTNQAAFKP
jgi:hypothetical protein